MNKVLVIVGPTAVGKTSFGLKCAKAFNGEIISGDSIQIYQGLDIGSAKVSKDDRDIVCHHLIDIKSPFDNYNVKEFQSLARNLINILNKENKLPIIVGGTGLYIKACLYDYEFLDEKEKDNEYLELSNEDIYNKLLKLDPKSLEKIHINNRKRLVRALNIYEKHQRSISDIKDNQEHKMLYDAKIIGLTCDREVLYQRINTRVDKMITDGLIDEIKSLLDQGVSFDNQAMQGIGYKEFKDYFNNEKSLEECVELVKKNSRNFAKRQYTFFNNQFCIEWFSDLNKAYIEVEKWLI